MLGLSSMLASADAGVEGGGFIILAAVILLIALGVPLYILIGAVVFLCYAVDWLPGADFFANFDRTSEMIDLIDTPDFVAIPFFMIAGAVMGRGLIAKKLIDIASAWLGWLPGGLGVSAIFACVFFAAISGSSPVTVVTIGAIMIPALKNAGYTNTMSYGLITSAGGLGIIIPPSIPMIVYSIYASNSGVPVKVSELFLAGFLPGIFIAVVLSLFTMVGARKAQRQPFVFKKAVASIGDGVWALFLPFFILGGIYSGLFNATQAAAMSVILAIGIEIGIHKSMAMRDVPKLIADNALLLGALLLIIMLATGFSSYAEDNELPAKLGELLGGHLSPIMFLLLLNLMLLLTGMVLDIISAIVLFVPLVVPLAAQMGFDPLHIGIIFIVNLEIGYLTPPIGLNLFVATSYFKQPFGMIVKSVAPFVLVMIASLAVISYVPAIAAGVPALSRGESFWVSLPEAKDPSAVAKDAETPAGEGTGTESENDTDKSMQDLMDSDPELQKLRDQLKAASEDDSEPAPVEDDPEMDEYEDEPAGGADASGDAGAVSPDAAPADASTGADTAKPSGADAGPAGDSGPTE
jgi:C4-dicarboxylate transporter DctM subunit